MSALLDTAPIPCYSGDIFSDALDRVYYHKDLTMRELISSLMRFSGAVTMFGIEQVQNTIGAPADTRAAIGRMIETLDAMSDSLISKIDEPKRAAHESMSKAQSEVVDGAFNAVDMNAPDELMKKTSASISSALARSAATGAGPA
jgi:hypothetical protein